MCRSARKLVGCKIVWLYKDLRLLCVDKHAWLSVIGGCPHDREVAGSSPTVGRVTTPLDS